MSQAQTIALYQPLLQSIAMRIVGSIHDAEDIVQETFLKWLTLEKEKINNTKAYLIKAVTNNCLNHINTLKRKKNECLENIKPGELIDWNLITDLRKMDLDQEVSHALNILHKKLEPLEKAIFLLREVFNFEYDELQHLFDKKKENCRQLFCRAKEKLNTKEGKIKIQMPNPASFLYSFKKANDLGQIGDFIQHLGNDISFKLKKN
ncbi:MAG: sigma-70 family RNA polymerase sigma factor [Bacteroidota bacterium]